MVREILDEIPLFQEVWIEGEITNLRIQSSGHYYFSLKDENAQVRCVMFTGKARLLRFRPQDKQKVLLRGSISLYERDGQFQIIADQMEPLGIGSMALAFEQLKNRLASEGLFAEERKRPLPSYPRVVGIVTSPSGAALRDMVQIMHRRYPGIRIILAPSLVQGEGAAEQIAAGISCLNRLEEVDVIVIGRGGGSQEDLWCFNEEIVARAAVASRKPVVSAVGHETDYSLADMVADLRAPTPSAAAEMIVPEIAPLYRHLDVCTQRLTGQVQSRIRKEQTALAASAERLEPARLLKWTADRRWRLQEREDRLHLALKPRLTWHRQVLENQVQYFSDLTRLESWVDQRRERLSVMTIRMQTNTRHRLHLGLTALEANGHKLQLLSPLKAMSRGFSAVRESDSGKVISSIKQIRSGDDVNIEFTDGQALARIVMTIAKEEPGNGTR